MSVTEIVRPKGVAKPAGVWSPAVTVVQPKKLVFLSGFAARDESGDIVCVGDITGQTQKVCENLKATMEAAGGTLADNYVSTRSLYYCSANPDRTSAILTLPRHPAASKISYFCLTER